MGRNGGLPVSVMLGMLGESKKAGIIDRCERIVPLPRRLKRVCHSVSLLRLMDELECSRATIYRVVAFLRDTLGARSRAGQASFRYIGDAADTFELPGLWLSSEELAVLLAMHTLLERADPGVLTGVLTPFRVRIE